MWVIARAGYANVPTIGRTSPQRKHGDEVAIEAHALPAQQMGPAATNRVTRTVGPSFFCGRLGAPMTSRIGRLAAYVLTLVALCGVPSLHAQYFGRNKV